MWLDFGWASGKRDRSGELVVDRHQWPHGLPWLTAWLHRHGLLAGIYTDAGRSGCHDKGVGSLGHYQQDADSFAAWGFDAVKVDFCGAGQQGLDPKPAYTRFAKALANNSSHRKLLLNVCNFWVPGQINGTRHVRELGVRQLPVGAPDRAELADRHRHRVQPEHPVGERPAQPRPRRGEPDRRRARTLERPGLPRPRAWDDERRRPRRS